MAVAGKVAITPRGSWNAETSYVKLDFVGFNGSSYVALQPSVGIEPTNTNYWMLSAIGNAEGGERNLVPFPYYETSGTESGITWTVNDDGTIGVSGTATADVSFTIRTNSENWKLPNGTYKLSGCPSGGSFNTYRLQIARFVDGTLTSYGQDYGSGVTFSITDNEPLLMQFVVRSGVTIDSVIKPMLVSVNFEYAPYYFGGAEKAKTLEGFLINQLYKQNRILTSADDMNTLFELGLYYYTSSDIPQNVPYQNASFVEVIRFNDNRQIQRVTRAGVSGYQTERVYSGTWQEWVYNINDKHIGQYALPLNRNGGTVSFTDYTAVRFKRNTDTEGAGVGIVFANNKSNVGMIVVKNRKLLRVDVSTWAEYEIFDTSNKPSGTYNGVTDAALASSIPIGDADKIIGDLLYIECERGFGLIGAKGGAYFGPESSERYEYFDDLDISFVDGILTIMPGRVATIFNKSGVVYKYRLL